MKKQYEKSLSILLSLIIVLISLMPVFSFNTVAAEDTGYDHVVFEDGKWIREIYDWEDFDTVTKNFNSSLNFQYGSLTIRLMSDLSMTSLQVLAGATYMRKLVTPTYSNVVFDFNGHTLSGSDTASETNQSPILSDFLCFYVGSSSTLTFEDSVGTGGVEFYSSTGVDDQLSALHIIGLGDTNDSLSTYDYYASKVIINGGNYKLTTKINKFSTGTLHVDEGYRGTVIADAITTVINDGNFNAVSEGVTVNGQDYAARELSAFATAITQHNDAFYDIINYGGDLGYDYPYTQSHCTINGGTFQSDGYSIHHFVNSYWVKLYKELDGLTMPVDSAYYMDYPIINGGIFKGPMGFTGLTFTYTDGNSEYNSLPASMIIPETARLRLKKGNGNIVNDVNNLDWEDLHNLDNCLIFSAGAVVMKTTPEWTDDVTTLTRKIDTSETFTINYDIAKWLKDSNLAAGYTVTPQFVVRDKKTSSSKNYVKDTLEINYADYPEGVTVECYVFFDVNGTVSYQMKTFDVDVLKIIDITTLCKNCHTSSLQEKLYSGETYSFYVEPDPFYELVNPDKPLEVYVNDEIPECVDGMYIVRNVTEDLFIQVSGSQFKGYSEFVFDNPQNSRVKAYVGETFIFPTAKEMGYSIPEGGEFDYWKVGTSSKKYYPGDEVTISKAQENNVKAVFTGLNPVTVIGGTAYSDAEHTKKINYAAAGSKVYIVLDETPPEGKVFYHWSCAYDEYGYSCDFDYYDDVSSYFLPEASFEMPHTGITLEPSYITEVSEVVVKNVQLPVTGEKFVINVDEYYNWTEKVPEGAGYSFSSGYWYVITKRGVSQLEGGEVFKSENTYFYQVTFAVNGIDYKFPDDPEDVNLVLDGIDESKYSVSGKTFVNDTETFFRVTAVFEPEEAPTTGVTVSGKVVSFGEETDITKVQLFADESEEAIKSVMVTGTNSEYNFEDVADGTYSLVVSKPNHVTRVYELEINGEDVACDMKIHLLGDISGDGKVNTIDVSRANANAKGVTALSGYEFACADINGDGRVNTIDVSRTNAHAKGVTSLW